jgi:hypothetical protein
MACASPTEIRSEEETDPAKSLAACRFVLLSMLICRGKVRRVQRRCWIFVIFWSATS